MIRALLCFIVLFPAVVLSQAARPGTAVPVEDIVEKLGSFMASRPAEKTYLQFDKPLYAAGDTLYFKAYVTMGERHQPSGISGVLYTDLIDPENKISQHIALKLNDGVAWGDIALPDTLPAGSYRIRAYTNWMRNDGNGAFFEQAIPVGSLQQKAVPENAAPGSRLSTANDIQFLPEGGVMVNGITSKIAFKAIGVFGTGIAVKGVVVDNESKEITKLASVHLGMGYFYITPQEGKTYKAKLDYADGTQNTVDLPQAATKGIILSVNNDSLPKASVRIEANRAFYEENKYKKYKLLVVSGGRTIVISCLLDSTVTTIDVLKRKLATGIARFTLFSPEDEPLCERLIFIQNFDKLNVNINADKPAYATRGKVDIRLNIRNRADDPVTGHFSVSVTDESKVLVNENAENTIESDLLLTSDLKGHVEQPGYYFTGITDKKLNELDLVMLTHGYRRFEWKQVVNDLHEQIRYQPETGLTISGVATNLSGNKLIANGTVSLIDPKGGAVLSVKTDSAGNFKFTDLAIADSTRFILQAVNAKGKDNTQIVYKAGNNIPLVQKQVVLNADTALQTYLQNSEKQQEELNKLSRGKGRQLKGVEIKGKKADVITQFGVPSQVIQGKDILYGGPLGLRLITIARNIHFNYDGQHFIPFLNRPSFGPMIVTINGFPGTLEQVNTDQIERIEIYTEPGAATSIGRSVDGVIAITTSYGWKSGDGHQVRALKEVKIKAIKPNDNYRSSNLGGAGHADVVIHADQLGNTGGTLSARLMGKTRGLINWVPNRFGGFTPYERRGVSGAVFAVMMDGQKLNGLDDVNPNNIETVEVLWGANASIYGMTGSNGLIVLTSKQGSGLDPKDLVSTGFIPVTVPGFYKAREFYSPKYDIQATSSLPDLRTTIYWKPELVPDKDGNVSFNYYNADGQGTYRIVVEGMDEKGNLARQVYRYKVQ